jgi:hypothetical protein
VLLVLAEESAQLGRQVRRELLVQPELKGFREFKVWLVRLGQLVHKGKLVLLALLVRPVLLVRKEFRD